MDGADFPLAGRTLLELIETCRAIVGVVGLGYVGLPLAAAMHDAGFRVIGFDVDPKKPQMIARGEAYLKHLGHDLVRRLGASDRFSATTDMSRLGEPDAVIVCVPTPMTSDHTPDLSYVRSTAAAIGASARPGQLFSLESTTYPGTTRDVFMPDVLGAAASRGVTLRPSADAFFAFSPEREDPGNQSFTTRTIPKLVGGVDEASSRLATALYAAAVERVIPVSSAEIAEAAKLLENIFRAVNIALVNEMKLSLGAMGIDVWEVVRAAATKPFGFMPFFPGPGLGGHCIPIDPFYMAWKARQVGAPARFIELAGEVNLRMPAHVISTLERALRAHGAARGTARGGAHDPATGDALRGSRVLVLGLAYKPDIDDVRESPSFELIRLMRERGAHADYSDPHVPATWPGRKGDLGMRSVELTPQAIASYDALVMSTNHSAFDLALLARHARLIVDTRDAFRPFERELGERLVRA